MSEGDHHPGAKLSARDVILLRLEPPKSLKDWALQKGVSLNTASQALHGRTWTCVNDLADPIPVDKNQQGRKAAALRWGKP